MKLYKILQDGKSCHGGDLKWSLPKSGKKGEWHEVTGSLDLCKTGIHLTDDPLKWYKPNATYYEAEYEGEILWDDTKSKYVVRKCRLIREVPHNAIWKELDTFITKDIKEVKFFKPQGKPLKEWKLFYGGTWDAARDAAWDATRVAARDAAWNAARDAVRDAVWNAVRDAARDATRDAAWDAAWDAELFSRFILVKDLKFKDKEKHQAHVNARWDVWKRGYGLLCDVDGVLYVYCKGKA